MMSPENHHRYEIAHRSKTLCSEGAIPVVPPFRTGEAPEFVHRRQRLILLANDALFQRHTRVMHQAGLPTVAKSEKFTDSQIVAAELPRSARNLPQIMRSREGEIGLRRTDVFRMLGERIAQLADYAAVVPDAADFSLQHVMLLRDREQPELLFVPSMHFVAESDDARAALATAVYDQLIPEFEQFDGDNLMRAFAAGMTGDE